VGRTFGGETRPGHAGAQDRNVELVHRRRFPRATLPGWHSRPVRGFPFEEFVDRGKHPIAHHVAFAQQFVAPLAAPGDQFSLWQAPRRARDRWPRNQRIMARRHQQHRAVHRFQQAGVSSRSNDSLAFFSQRQLAGPSASQGRCARHHCSSA
jgi:hypothetical protein